jgi:hypothetical protein
MQQYRVAPYFMEHSVRSLFDFEAMRDEGFDEIRLAQRSGAEMVLERLGGNGALNRFAVDECGKRDHEIARAIRRDIVWKGNMHGGHLCET